MAGLNNILPRLSQNFQNAITSILPQLQQWANTVSNVAIQIGDYLQPKLVALWNTIRESMPTFKQLYEEVLQPLAVAFGTTLVVAFRSFSRRYKCNDGCSNSCHTVDVRK